MPPSSMDLSQQVYAWFCRNSSGQIVGGKVSSFRCRSALDEEAVAIIESSKVRRLMPWRLSMLSTSLEILSIGKLVLLLRI
jgi:hypothetical protein